MTTANHRERQLMQHLRGAGWVKAGNLPSSPKTFAILIAKGWIEPRGTGSDISYRITDEGLTAKMARVRIYG
jgi:hypothetical protein